jgi:hypothetical protein
MAGHHAWLIHNVDPAVTAKRAPQPGVDQPLPDLVLDRLGGFPHRRSAQQGHLGIQQGS